MKIDNCIHEYRYISSEKLEEGGSILELAYIICHKCGEVKKVKIKY